MPVSALSIIFWFITGNYYITLLRQLSYKVPFIHLENYHFRAVPLGLQNLSVLQALFRALKTKHETPKYGLIYHASLIGQAAPKFKGKISRVLAAKSALSIRMDALGDTTEASIGIESRAKVCFSRSLVVFPSCFTPVAFFIYCPIFFAFSSE